MSFEDQMRDCQWHYDHAMPDDDDFEDTELEPDELEDE